jgi:hypothetical protein
MSSLFRNPIAQVVTAPSAGSEDRQQQNQSLNFHGRCPQLDGREVVNHKPVTELLDAEKILKAV